MLPESFALETINHCCMKIRLSAKPVRVVVDDLETWRDERRRKISPSARGASIESQIKVLPPLSGSSRGGSLSTNRTATNAYLHNLHRLPRLSHVPYPVGGHDQELSHARKAGEGRQRRVGYLADLWIDDETIISAYVCCLGR